MPRRFDPIAQWAVTTPTAPAIEQWYPSRQQWSYAEVDTWVAGAGAWLAQHGVRAGDRVAMLMANRVECLVLAIAAWRRGATIVPLNWRLAPVELARLVAHASPRLLVVDADHATRAMSAVVALEAAGRPYIQSLPAVWPTTVATRVMPPEAVAADEPAMLLYTSGSTGRPKGVCVTHGQLMANAVSTAQGWGLNAQDRALVATPLFHTAGWHAFTTPVLATGGTVVLAGDFEPMRMMAVLADAQITRTFLVPTQLLMLQQTARWGVAVPALRQCLIGGAPCPTSARNAALAVGYPVVEAYGLTEFGPNCFTIDVGAPDRPPGLVGTPLPGVEARIVDVSGQQMPVGAVGALEFRGPQQCAGYAGDVPATAALFTADGWVRTGDLASIDTEGAVRIAGRVKELFISGGEHVYPGEVERAIRELPEVDDVVVVALPDPFWGEVGCAVVQRRSALDPASIVHHLRSTLAGYKVPRYLWPIDAFPLLGSGKIDRERVVQLARTALLGEDSPMMVLTHEAERR